MKESREVIFPDFVCDLAQADYGSHADDTITGYLVQGDGHQVVFNENRDPITFKRHRHEASFGVVLQGQCEFVFFYDDDSGGEREVRELYRAGEVYRVPAQVDHYAIQSANYKDIVIFNEPRRVAAVTD